ncbi:hypothetical protein HDK77DRAFT_58454 [Phyllosticta capitalensis]|uniref:Uncharacterized protein n=1 Tax=Phyllosticta capitalensis TaxID=121624 RepID=A0ABR1Y9C2_9PEZI
MHQQVTTNARTDKTDDGPSVLDGSDGTGRDDRRGRTHVSRTRSPQPGCAACCLLARLLTSHLLLPTLAFRFSMLPVVASSLFFPCFCLLAPLLRPTTLFHTYFLRNSPHTPSFPFLGFLCISISRSRARFVFLIITACIRSPMFSLLPSSHPIASCLHQYWSAITSSLLFLHSIITLVCLTSFLLQSPSPLPISRYPNFAFFFWFSGQATNVFGQRRRTDENSCYLDVPLSVSGIWVFGYLAFASRFDIGRARAKGFFSSNF